MEKSDSTVYSPGKIGNVEIPNRLVRSATYESRATVDGHITDELINLYGEFARGGIGLTITGVTNVREDGRQLSLMVGNYSDEYLEDLSRVAGTYHDVVKEEGNNSKIFLQIGHSGSHITQWGWPGEVISSCDLEYELTHKNPKPLNIDEIAEIVDLYSEAAHRGKKAGYDGVQFHGAHGYLITQFYSPYLNRRKDEYGGSTENRARFMLEIIKASREKVDKDFPLCLKMNGSDRLDGGVDVEEAVKLGIIFAQAGIDSLEISSYIHKAGTLERPASLPPESQRDIRERNREAFNLPLAKKIKEALKKKPNTDIPIILVGGLYRFEPIRDIIEKDGIDFCSMARPLIREPGLPKEWSKGPPYKEADCVHCNDCLRDSLIRGPKSKGIRCIRKEKEERKKKKVKI